MDTLTQALKEHALKSGADLVGIASIDRFAGIAPEHNPAAIFPEARSVVVIGRRITRGTLRGVEEGTQMGIYNLYGADWLDNRFVAITTFRVAEFLEDQRWEAVPLAPLPPQIPPSGVPVKPGLPAPNVMVDIEDAAVRAGLGEIGYCRSFLSPRFGPRQRFQAIITDAELTPDPILQEAICTRCLEPAKICPLAVHFADKKHPGLAEFVRELPDFFRLYANAVHRIGKDHHAIAALHGSLCFRNEVEVSRGIDQGELQLFPGEGIEGTADCGPALDFFGLEIKYRGILVYLAESGRTTRIKNHGLCQRGFARAAVGNECKGTNICDVLFHVGSFLLKIKPREGTVLPWAN